MKRATVAKLVGGLGCLALIVVLAPGLLLGELLIAGSQRTIYQRAKSPDGWHEARVQFDDGGAISGFDRIVFVKHNWNLSDEPLLSCRAFWGNGEASGQIQTDGSHRKRQKTVVFLGPRGTHPSRSHH